MRKMTSAGSTKNKHFFFNKDFFLYCIPAILVFFSSCDKKALFEKNTPLYNAEWSKHEIIPFEVNISDTASVYNFYINIRNNTDYAYANLYLFMNTRYPDKEVSRDTIECILADKNGKWFGKGWGKYRFLSLPLGKNVKFFQTGTYIFEFEQAMRTDTLKNISDIGIRIEKSI